MNVLFLLLDMPAPDMSGDMYVHLAEQFLRNGHEVTIMAPDVAHKQSFVEEERGLRVVRVRSRATQGVKSMYKKGIALATLEYYFKEAYCKFLKDEQFDWIIMPTPPITLSGFAAYAKRKSHAKFYLILRDIHPQSVWSIGLLHNKVEYWFLDIMARKGYQAADIIGCMSSGNKDFIRNQYPTLNTGELTLLYNWIKAPEFTEDKTVRTRHGLEGKFVTLFGGNLGKGQRVENIVYLARHYLANENIVFLVIAKGVEKDRLLKMAEDQHLTNIWFKDFMPQTDFLNLTSSVDLGLVSINENYSVPTCPSKAVSYMAAGIPILAMINPGNDYGQIIEDSGAGYWAVGSDKQRVIELFDKIYSESILRKRMSVAGKLFYQQHCTVEIAYKTMINQMEKYHNGE